MSTPFPFVPGAVLQAQQLNDIQNLPISDKTADYVLVVGDVTKRTIMNSASATTITVDNSIFTVGDVIQVANKGAGTCTITAGAGVTINTSGSLALAQYGGGYLLALSASTFTFFNLGGGGNPYGVATGGTETTVTDGGFSYTLCTFTSTGTLTVSTPGIFDVIVFGGGGGGGAAGAPPRGGGGGGAGSMFYSTIYIDATQTVTIGAGGNGGSVAGAVGTQSKIGDLCVGYGGSGGMFQSPTVPAFTNIGRGCGGGAAENHPTAVGTDELYAFKGGTNVSNNAGGGGGGVQAVGGNASGTTGGAGGAGFDVTVVTTASTFKGGGGGGGGGTGGAGGSSVGGAGGSNAVGAAAAANTASGGGGGGNANNGGNGGSGIVLLRFRT
jgi:hypothetical protein